MFWPGMYYWGHWIIHSRWALGQKCSYPYAHASSPARSRPPVPAGRPQRCPQRSPSGLFEEGMYRNLSPVKIWLPFACTNHTRRVFGFLCGAVAAGASIYYYVLGDYRTSNEMLNQDISVSFAFASWRSTSWINWLNARTLLPWPCLAYPGNGFLLCIGSSICYYEITILHLRAGRKGRSAEEEIGISLFSGIHPHCIYSCKITPIWTFELYYFFTWSTCFWNDTLLLVLVSVIERGSNAILWILKTSLRRCQLI